jgi:hypothetical protein
MSFRGLRSALAAEPRWIIAVLLAFALETLPSAALVTHRHAAGDVGHDHVGPRVRGAAAPVRTESDGLTRAPARDLHRHLSHLLTAVRPPDVAAPGPIPLAIALRLGTGSDERSAPWDINQARGPPSLDA